MALLLSEVKNLIKKIGKLSNGQARIVEIGEFMNLIKVEIFPNDGVYKGGRFLFKIRVDPYNLKTQAPTVICLSPIYHPNIDTSDLSDMDKSDDEFNSNICLSMLDDWQSSYGLDGLVNGLLFLFYHPEIEDSLSPYIDQDLSPEEFEENVQRSLLGEEVDGIPFERNISDDQYNILQTKFAECSNTSDVKIIVTNEVNKDISLKEAVPNSNIQELTTSIEPDNDKEKKMVAEECGALIESFKNNNLLPIDAISRPTEKINFQPIKMADKKQNLKSFDRCSPECDFVVVLVDSFLRRFFCCQ